VTDALIERAVQRFGMAAGELLVGGLPVGALAAEHGTPLYVYGAELMDRALERLRAALPPRVEIAYSVKANPNPALLRRFLARGLGLEVASAGELTLARHAGCPPARIVFAGPGKTDAELALALDEGIAEIHVESLGECERLAALARRRGRPAPVAIRVNPSAEAQGGAMRMGGRPGPFGVDEEALDDVLACVLGDGALELRGLHVYSGTQILAHEVLAGQYGKALALARRVARRAGRPLATLDLGGGLGVPYVSGEPELDLDALREALTGVMGGLESDPWLATTRLLVEPGRFLVAEAGVYVTRVVDVKRSKGKTFVVLDGGMHHHLAASGNLGQVIKRNFPVALVGKLGKAPTETADLVGPLCTPLDTLARELPVPAPEVGDLVGVFQSGAYGLTASPTGFLSHPAPAEVLVERGVARLIRRRGSHADLLRDLTGA
jgi:diaminopimelate decarboxylase